MYLFDEAEVREACRILRFDERTTYQIQCILCEGKTQKNVAEISGITQPAIHKRLRKVKTVLGLKGVITVFAGRRLEFTGNISQIAKYYGVSRRTLSWKIRNLRPESSDLVFVIEEFITQESKKI